MIFIKVAIMPFVVLRSIFHLLVIHMPGGFGIKLRYHYYRGKFKKCGDGVVIDVGVHIDGIELISVGNNVHIDKYCVISTGRKLTGEIKRRSNAEFSGEDGEIILGNDIHIAPFCIIAGYGGVEIESNCVLSSGCRIYSLTNTAYDLNDRSRFVSIMPYSQAPFLLAPIVVRHNTWLALNTVVMPAVTIGKNSFCATNSVVMHDMVENSYGAGQPARRVRDRFEVRVGE